MVDTMHQLEETPPRVAARCGRSKCLMNKKATTGDGNKGSNLVSTCRRAKYKVGTRILKRFDGHGKYEGVVAAFDGDHYRIHYRDGDEGDMSEEEFELSDVEVLSSDNGSSVEEEPVLKPRAPLQPQVRGPTPCRGSPAAAFKARGSRPLKKRRYYVDSDSSCDEEENKWTPKKEAQPERGIAKPKSAPYKNRRPSSAQEKKETKSSAAKVARPDTEKNKGTAGKTRRENETRVAKSTVRRNSDPKGVKKDNAERAAKASAKGGNNATSGEREEDGKPQKSPPSIKRKLEGLHEKEASMQEAVDGSGQTGSARCGQARSSNPSESCRVRGQADPDPINDHKHSKEAMVMTHIVDSQQPQTEQLKIADGIEAANHQLAPSETSAMQGQASTTRMQPNNAEVSTATKGEQPKKKKITQGKKGSRLRRELADHNSEGKAWLMGKDTQTKRKRMRDEANGETANSSKLEKGKHAAARKTRKQIRALAHDSSKPVETPEADEWKSQARMKQKQKREKKCIPNKEAEESLKEENGKSPEVKEEPSIESFPEANNSEDKRLLPTSSPETSEQSKDGEITIKSTRKEDNKSFTTVPNSMDKSKRGTRLLRELADHNSLPMRRGSGNSRQTLAAALSAPLDHFNEITTEAPKNKRDENQGEESIPTRVTPDKTCSAEKTVDPKYPVGTLFFKMFGDDRYGGLITSYDGELYKVRYPKDGDEEELSDNDFDGSDIEFLPCKGEDIVSDTDDVESDASLGPIICREEDEELSDDEYGIYNCIITVPSQEPLKQGRKRTRGAGHTTLPNTSTSKKSNNTPTTDMYKIPRRDKFCGKEHKPPSNTSTKNESSL